MSVAWPCSISPYSTSTLLGRSMPASVCRTLPSNPKTTSAPLGAGALFVPRIRLRSGTDAWIQTAGSSGSSDTDAVARAGRTSTGTWAGEQAAQSIATATEPSRVSVRTGSFCARRRGRRTRAAGIAGPRGTRALPRRGWAPSGTRGPLPAGGNGLPTLWSRPFRYAAAGTRRRAGSYVVPVLSMAISTTSNRSITPRIARACPCPRWRSAR